MPKTLLDSIPMPFAPPGTETYGFQVIQEVWDVNGERKIYWKYRLPNMVQIVPLTPEGKIIGISEWQPNVGADYLHLPGETFDEGETDPLAVAERGLLEETGYESKQITLLSTILENSGRSDRLIYVCLARECVKATAGEKGIKAKLFSPESFWNEMMQYFFANAGTKHGGGNTLKALTLAYQKLDWLKVATSTV